jgi:hypothetical protein
MLITTEFPLELSGVSAGRISCATRAYSTGGFAKDHIGPNLENVASLCIAPWALWISQHGADGVPIRAHPVACHSRGDALRHFIAAPRSRQLGLFHSWHFSLTPYLIG